MPSRKCSSLFSETSKHRQLIMAEDHFEVRKEGTVLTVVLGANLSVVNASALTDEINLYKGQDIEKLVFDATKLTYITFVTNP